MPVTKTAKRALRSSKRKTIINKDLLKKLEISLRAAKRDGGKEKIVKAISLADRAAKKKVIHKNKADRIKSALSKLLPKVKTKISSSKKPARKSGKKQAS